MNRLSPVCLGVAAFALSIPPAAAQGWHVAIEENPGLTNCGTTKGIPVSGATDCATAQTAAWNLFSDLVKRPNCIQTGCPAGSSIKPANITCKQDPYTRPNGSKAMRWQIGVTWSCTPASSPPVLPCCQCLGATVSVDLSTGVAGNPADANWKLNGGAAYPTPPYPGWNPSLAPAKWVQPVASPAPSGNIPSGTYLYAVQAVVPKCTIPMDVRLEGSFAADNAARVSLDGAAIANCAGPKCFAAPLVLNAAPAGLSAPGTHTLSIAVTNDGGPSGLAVNAKLVGQCRRE